MEQFFFFLFHFKFTIIIYVFASDLFRVGQN